MGWDPLWAWLCAVLDPQDAINELFKCVLRVYGQENGGPDVWTAAWLYEQKPEPLPVMRSARELIAEAEDDVRAGSILKDCLIRG